MLFQLFTFVSYIVTTMATPALQAPNGHHLNCTFTINLTELCHFSTTPELSTSAALDTIMSPWGNGITNYTEGLNIDDSPLTIYASNPQESIAGRLDIERPNNTKAEFKWTYGPSGGRPITERWSEDKEGSEGRYGCVVNRDWDADSADCDDAQPTSERNKLLDCWFKCNAVADSDSRMK